MTNPYTAPIPPTPRPLHRRVLVWVGGTALFVTGALIGSAGNDGQQPVETKVKPSTTITATVTATPEPGPTVTETVKAKAKPGPTVTVTKTATAKAAGSGSGSGSSGQDSAGTCTIVSNAGNCYSAGQFCRNSDHGAVTTTAGGVKIECAYSSNAWRWTYI
ncbi:hypothetical protein ACIPSJ_07805 [Streptomyces sp. NPDC090088]|uniref:hypothetical protein n=1 Tax=Streptomyces sp. NPDC090088 TaxID=3365944 RepID=UPI00382CAC0A